MEKYTLITGASSGMGAVCAKLLSTSRNLILAGSNAERLEMSRQLCDNPEKHLIWVCDFATERENVGNSLKSLLTDNEAVVTEFVHFAGTTKILPIKDFAIPYIDKIFNVNFFSAVEIIRVLLKRVNQKSLCNIVLISALMSQRGNVGNSIYAASKGAINSLVYTLSQELASAIRINALMPGAVETPMTKDLNQDYIQRITEATPLGLGSSEDVANYVEFLLDEKSRWITGQTLFVDGGLSTKF